MLNTYVCDKAVGLVLLQEQSGGPVGPGVLVMFARQCRTCMRHSSNRMSRCLMGEGSYKTVFLRTAVQYPNQPRHTSMDAEYDRRIRKTGQCRLQLYSLTSKWRIRPATTIRQQINYRTSLGIKCRNIHSKTF